MQKLTDEEKQAVREMSSMKAFTFFIDDVTKLEVMQKLKDIGCDTKKGSFSALIRVLLSMFARNENPQYIDYVREKVNEEYLFTTKRNKRSTM